MTREEAIEFIAQSVKSDVDMAKVADAIKALEQEPTTKNDLGVEKIIDEVEKEFEKVDIPIMDKLTIFAKVQNALYKCAVSNNSVGMIRPKGHWIETAEEYYKAINEKGGGVNENTDYFVDNIACSECLAKFSVIDNEAERFDFCPCCGSDNR